MIFLLHTLFYNVVLFSFGFIKLLVYQTQVYFIIPFHTSLLCYSIFIQVYNNFSFFIQVYYKIIQFLNKSSMLFIFQSILLCFFFLFKLVFILFSYYKFY